MDSILKDLHTLKIEINGTNSESFTTNTVLQEMKKDWGISKDNQLLFIWSSICEVLIGESTYNGNDGDSKRLKEIEVAFDYYDFFIFAKTFEIFFFFFI